MLVNKTVSENFLPSKTVLLTGSDVEAKRAEILDYFHQTFSLYENIYECLKDDEAFYLRPNTLRHPLIFYYGHTAVFFMNKLNLTGLIKNRIDPTLEDMMAIGVDEMSWDDLDPNHYDWPTVDEVREYRNIVRDKVDNFIRNCSFELPIDEASPLWIIMMGIEHERIHLETTSVLLRELSLEHLVNHSDWQPCRESGVAPMNSLIDVVGGEIALGKDKSNSLYGWDNEYGTHDEKISPFKASKYLVSNQEFLEFVKDDGYKTQSYWTAEGWSWCSDTKTEYPHFWLKSGESYRYRTMLEEMDMPWDWPVDLNHLEAHAFCEWMSAKTGKNIHLPTEAQWYMLRNKVTTDQPYWDEAPGNINLEYYASSCPVNQFEFADGFYDIIGNVWQWTATEFDGFEGFEVHPAYDDFSTPTFDTKHNVFKGGCWASTGNYAIKDSRYAFRRHFFQHSGLRYIESA
ncbi:MAG: 5-histidylcysteine sulfoxide synthase [Rickettsiales bacterium]|nr:5-histidylcysteine sulfoxide synthase [Rickettsiales bacterium]